MQTDTSPVIDTASSVKQTANRSFGASLPRSTPSDEKIKALPIGARYIALTKGAFTIIDEADYESANKHLWFLGAGGYARRNGQYGTRSSIALHRELIKAPKGKFVDHISGDRLDNRRANLRFATNAQNKWNAVQHRDNTSGFKGVSWAKQAKKWRAKICRFEKQYHLGYFKTPAAAHAAYCAAAARLHGEFARVK